MSFSKEGRSLNGCFFLGGVEGKIIMEGRLQLCRVLGRYLLGGALVEVPRRGLRLGLGLRMLQTECRS